VESMSSEDSNGKNNDPNHKSKYMYNRSLEISSEKPYLGKRNVENMTSGKINKNPKENAQDF